MFITLNSTEDFNRAINQNKAVLIYFSHDECNVCKILKPKISELITEQFPNITLCYCNTINNPEISAQNSVFTVPAILVFIEGKEFIRKSRNIGVEELGNLIERAYKLLFS